MPFSFQYFLDTLARLLFRLVGIQVSEDVKIPVTKECWPLIIHHSIHVLPVAVAVSLISINLSGRYIGAHLGRGSVAPNDSVLLAFIQVFAKIHASIQQLSPCSP